MRSGLRPRYALTRLSESAIAFGGAGLTISIVTTANARGEHGNATATADDARAEYVRTRIKKSDHPRKPKEPRQWPMLL